MDFKQLAADLAKMTPEERNALAVLFTAGAAPAGAALPQVDMAALEEAKKDLSVMYPRLDDARLTKLALEHVKSKQERRPGKPPRAETVYFFQQNALFVTERITVDEEDTSKLKKTGYFLPPRVIAVDAKQAARLYYKQGAKFGYLGRSPGAHWAQARMHGMNVQEAFAVEFDEFKKNPDQTAPPSREKTFFAGTKPGAVARGQEIDWSLGFRQKGQ